MSPAASAASAAPRVRMSPEQRREQLIGIGVRLLSTRTLEELSIETLAEEAGISRGLLYHYFGNKQDFHLAVVGRAVDDLVQVTAPGEGSDLAEVLTGSLAAYVDYVVANHVGYRSLVRSAIGGNEELRALYEQAREVLTGRMFERAGPEGIEALGYDDTPATRLMVRGWAALAEEVVLVWAEDPTAMARQDLLAALAGSLFAALDAAR